MDPLLRSFAGRIFPKLSVALAFSGILALATNSTLEHGLHYFSAICLLMSLWLLGVAVARRRPLEKELSEWDEGLLLSLIGVGAHFLAIFLSP
jgi:hypothetical protein